MRAAAALGAASAILVACNAILGVEDVRLAQDRDGATSGDETDPPEGGGPLDAATTPEASVELALGFNHTCARKLDGRVRCWGENGAGQLGDGVPFEAGARSPALVPQLVVGIDDAVQLAAGVGHACAVRRSGAVACWGLNSFGQLGDGTTTRSSSPVAVKNLTDAIAVACGTSFSCALRRGGEVSCWGANYSGQLGDGTKSDRPEPAPVASLSGAIGVAAAEHHACAVLSGGAVTCWGQNDDGQLGNGTVVESLTPAPVPSLSDVAQVVSAARFSCARQRSGQVSCWGANDVGQLGTGVANAAPNPSPALTRVSDAVAVWVGYEHGCAVRRSGQVACWGAADRGQVGSGTAVADASIPEPTTVVGLSGALGISTGGDHSCATTRTGAVFCWGANTLGQLGDGTKNSSPSAVPVVSFP